MPAKRDPTKLTSDSRGWFVGLPATVILLGLTSLFTDIGTEMIFPLLPVFLVETLGAPPAYLGLVEGAANTVSSLVKLASGTLADRTTRRKPLVLFGYGLAGAARPLFAIATQPWHVLLVRVTDRIGKGVRGSPRDALIADAAGDRAGRAFGFHQAMDNAGAVVGPLLATALVAAKMPLRHIFLVAIVPGAIAFALVVAIREPRRHPAPARAGPAKAGGVVFGRSLVTYLGILAIFSLGNSSDAFLLVRARSVGLATAEIPILWALLNLSKVVWSLVGGDLADRIARTRIVASGWMVYAAVYFGLGTATAQWQVWALFALYGVFYGLTEPVEKAIVNDLVTRDGRGRAFGAYNFIVGIASLPASVLTGGLWNAFGPAVALDTGAGIAGAAALMLIAWDRWRGSRPPGEPSVTPTATSGLEGSRVERTTRPNANDFDQAME